MSTSKLSPLAIVQRHSKMDAPTGSLTATLAKIPPAMSGTYRTMLAPDAKWPRPD
jgi:hypothetical protein